MRKRVAVENVSLDGLMRQAMGQGMANAGAMLFARRTNIDFLNVWPRRTNKPIHRSPQQRSEIGVVRGGGFEKLKLVSAIPTTTGVVIATYQVTA